MKKPKDIGLKIATKREALWIRGKENLIKHIQNLEDDLEVNKEYLKTAEKIIKEENAH